MDIVESHAPLRSRRFKHPKQPDWMNPDIIQAIHEGEELKSAWFHNGARILSNEAVGLKKQRRCTTILLLKIGRKTANHCGPTLRI